VSVIRISHPTGIINGTVRLDGSKSISNRVLIIRALSSSNFKITGLSSSDDTQVLQKLLSEDTDHYDVHHAGTAFRFLTAYLALREGTQVLTGSTRMLERPIGPLVDALRVLNCNIDYLGQEGYPPLQIHGPGDLSEIYEVRISADVSSQYITALILVAPTLPNGLTIHLEGDMVSESYLKMTLATVQEFGIDVEYGNGKIIIGPQTYTTTDYSVEADWSAASYHYALAALAKEASLELEGLFSYSTQGDAAMEQIGNRIGVTTVWDNKVSELFKSPHDHKLEYDFINQPDITQTLAVICAAKGAETNFSGLKTLRIKETDRIAALDTELKKVGGGFQLSYTEESGEEHYKVLPISRTDDSIPRFTTYKDHRMAMAFAPLALLFPIEIEHPGVVSKSYPGFWQDLESLGFIIEDIPE